MAYVSCYRARLSGLLFNDVKMFVSYFFDVDQLSLKTISDNKETSESDMTVRVVVRVVS